MISGRLATGMDSRYLVAAGLILICSSFYIMTGWTPDVSQRDIILTIILQGAGMGLVFTSLQVLAFATLTASLRTEAASLFSLVRNIGAAIGVSVTSAVLARNTQALHEVIGASVTPFNRTLAAVGTLDPTTQKGAALLDRMISQQAEIIAYVNDYVLLICTTLPAILLLLLMHRPRHAPAVDAEPTE
jgi:DHA2 family multidrug resistance protein